MDSRKALATGTALNLCPDRALRDSMEVLPIDCLEWLLKFAIVLRCSAGNDHDLGGLFK